MHRKTKKRRLPPSRPKSHVQSKPPQTNRAKQGNHQKHTYHKALKTKSLGQSDEDLTGLRYTSSALNASDSTKYAALEQLIPLSSKHIRFLSLSTVQIKQIGEKYPTPLVLFLD